MNLLATLIQYKSEEKLDPNGHQTSDCQTSALAPNHTDITCGAQKTVIT